MKTIALNLVYQFSSPYTYARFLCGLIAGLPAACLVVLIGAACPSCRERSPCYPGFEDMRTYLKNAYEYPVDGLSLNGKIPASCGWNQLA